MNRNFWLFPLALCVAGQARADFWDVNRMMENMNSDSQVLRTAATAYIMGVHDAGNSIVFCSPRTVTGGQVRDVVRYFVERMPEVRESHAAVVVTTILKTHWPCKGTL